MYSNIFLIEFLNIQKFPILFQKIFKNMFLLVHSLKWTFLINLKFLFKIEVQ